MCITVRRHGEGRRAMTRRSGRSGPPGKRRRIGIGARAVNLLEGGFPDARRWALETPQWNTRNHRFYEKLGYARVGLADSGDFLYEKRLTRSPDRSLDP
jgi:hypothetical protein